MSAWQRVARIEELIRPHCVSIASHRIALHCIAGHGTASLLLTTHTDQLDGFLPAYRRGTLRGMDAA
ncbi:hypothetical protein FHR59_001219 [Xanthomonas arboricola]|nr:hypothetical protein [Xanthomonas arboricola]